MFFFKSQHAEHAKHEGGAPSTLPDAAPVKKSKGLRSLREFAQSKSGNVAILFGLVAVPFVSLAGLSVDFASASREKTRIQASLDAAALAAGREFQVSGNTQSAKDAAALYFLRQTGYTLSVNSIDPGTFILTVGANESVNTSFMGLLGSQFDQLAVNATSKAQLVRQIQGDKVEVSMMLDITGSMEWLPTSGGDEPKIDSMKTAAKDLVNILVEDGDNNVRVGLAPFSYAVNVKGKFNKFTGTGSNSDNKCVKERTGANRYTDEKPSAANGYFEVYGNCTGAAAKVFPLSSNKTSLLNRITNLPTGGGTAGHMGTAWAWYLLSKKWSSGIWGSARSPSSTDNGVKKIAVLLSDGDYNTWYSGDNSDTQAEQLCDAMKADGIEIYAVGFDLAENTTPYDRLEDCATDAAHFFPAADGEELKSAFRTIGFTIAQLRLVE